MSVVLIVDDSPSDRALFRTILGRAGYSVNELGYGREAIDRIRSLRPHAVVLDVNLPDIDGHALCRAIKADPEISSIPVLMLTVRDNQDDVLAGLEAGADDYVAKDAAAEIVLARVRRLIQFRQLTTVAVLNEHLVQVGRLLAGIVHEIRSPLSVIRGSAELLKLRLGPDDPLLDCVEPILRSTQLLQVRLEHLMATVRGGRASVRSVTLGPLLAEATDLFLKGRNPVGRQVLVESDCPATLPDVQADPGRLMLVLLSLMGNAREAIEQSGKDARIQVQVSTAKADDRNWVTIRVCDNGPGITPAVLPRIFEPFFTTKENGSGYGLYLAQETLREQGARLTAENLPDGGACFTVWLIPTGAS